MIGDPKTSGTRVDRSARPLDNVLQLRRIQQKISAKNQAHHWFYAPRVRSLVIIQGSNFEGREVHAGKTNDNFHVSGRSRPDRDCISH